MLTFFFVTFDSGEVWSPVDISRDRIFKLNKLIEIAKENSDQFVIHQADIEGPMAYDMKDCKWVKGEEVFRSPA